MTVSYGERFKRHRNRLRTHLPDTCDIYAITDVTKGSITKKERVLVCAGVKCRLSKENASPSQNAGAVYEHRTEATLIMCDNIKIMPGSEFDVYSSGVERPSKYKYAGESFIYPTHQEITLVSRGRS